MDDLISRQAAIDAIEITPFDDYGDYMRAKELIEQLPSAQSQRWIPVTERLPEYGTGVVTINKDDEYEINHVIDEEDGEWFFDGAVAWMPLPEVFKGEQE